MPANPEAPTADSCPPWCDVNHNEQAMEADRKHISDYTVVPIVGRRIVRDDETFQLIEMPIAEDVTIAKTQRVGGGEVWVTISTDRDEIAFAIDGAVRVSKALAAVLDPEA